MRVVHCRREAYDVYIGRPSKWGNTHSHLPNSAARYRTDTREAAVEYFERDMRQRWSERGESFVDEYLRPIAGKTLGCWCAPQLCHGEVWVKLCREAGLIE